MPDLFKDEPTIYTIPENFIDESRIFKGMFKTRNFVEGAAMAGLIALLAYLIPSTSVTQKITVMVTICAPFFMLGVSGFNGDSLFQTVLNARSWFSCRGIMLYNGNTRALSKAPLDVKMEQEMPRDKIIDYMDKIKANRVAKRSGMKFIEGVNFEFEEDKDLSGYYADEIGNDAAPAEPFTGGARAVEKAEDCESQESKNESPSVVSVSDEGAGTELRDRRKMETTDVPNIPLDTSIKSNWTFGEEDLFGGEK